ncbi:MAG TPA: hypothetical protein VM870_07260, partial [Pyrinomonadaceae bacterium]|nr:hypothetical protein [Pyrinomonadaceae bacterium]
TIIMTTSEDRFRGRVFASYETALTLTLVVSILLSGISADRYGLRLVTACGGLVIVLSGLLWFMLSRWESIADQENERSGKPKRGIAAGN